MLYVVVDVGCFECGVSTELVGVYTDEGLAEEAEQNRIARRYSSAGWRDGGSAEVMTFRVTKFNEDVS